MITLKNGTLDIDKTGLNFSGEITVRLDGDAHSQRLYDLLSEVLDGALGGPALVIELAPEGQP